MQKLICLWLFSILLFIAGCKKNDKEAAPFQMKAGAVDPNGYYFDYQPDYVFRIKPMLCGNGDSIFIDINHDSINDIQMRYEEETPATSSNCCPPGLECVYPDLVIMRWIWSVNANLQIAVDSASCHGSYPCYTLQLESNTSIDRSLYWSSNDQYLSNKEVYSGHTFLEGFWWGGTHFAGIRLLLPNDTLYGWIRINADSTIKVMDFALEGHH